MSVFEIIKLGRKYMQLWPEKVELARYFEEYRAIQLSRLVCKYFPAIGLFIFIIQVYLGGLIVLPQAFVYALFIISIPVQALIILGVKADKFLPPSLAAWYKEAVAKMNQQGGDIKLSLSKPRYFDLASLLRITYSNANYRS